MSKVGAPWLDSVRVIGKDIAENAGGCPELCPQQHNGLLVSKTSVCFEKTCFIIYIG